MDSHELIRATFALVSPREIAEKLRLKVPTIYKWGEKPGEGQSGALNPLDRVAELFACTGDIRLVQWLCARADGFFVANAPQSGSSKSPTQATSEIVQEFADMLSVIAQAALDNAISPDETQSIRFRWEELKSVAEAFVTCCEQGDFVTLAAKVRPPLLTARTAPPRPKSRRRSAQGLDDKRRGKL